MTSQGSHTGELIITGYRTIYVCIHVYFYQQQCMYLCPCNTFYNTTNFYSKIKSSHIIIVNQIPVW